MDKGKNKKGFYYLQSLIKYSTLTEARDVHFFKYLDRFSSHKNNQLGGFPNAEK